MTELRSSGRKIDQGNSYASSLTNGEVFTGVWLSTKFYSSVIIQINTDQDSAANGLQVQMGAGEDVASHVHPFTVHANTPNGGHFELALTGDRYRIVYTNGATTTGTFNLFATPSRVPAGLHMHPGDFAFNISHPLQINRSVITGINKQGAIQNIGNTNGALDVHDADVHNILINRHFLNFDSATESPSVAIVAGDTTILVASTTGFSVGDGVVIRDAGGSVREHHLTITALSVDVSITLDRPTDIAYTTSAIIELVSHNIVSVGSLVAPVIYEIAPPIDEIWHITRILVSITDGTAMDDAKFGGISALTNGVVLRQVKDATNTLTIWKSNSQLIEDMYDVNYSTKSPAGSYGLRGRFTFKNAGVAVRLDGSNGDRLQLLNQDDLNLLETFSVKAQGHIEE
jgi:hypothetical protein